MEKNNDETNDKIENEPKLPHKTKKRYPHGVLTGKELKLIQKKQEIKDKWKKELSLEEKIIPKKGLSHERRIVVTDGEPEVHECCVNCNVWKPLYKFYMCGKFLDMESTKESIRNDSQHPCIECIKEIRAEQIKNDPDSYIKRLLYNYPKLDIKWYRNQIKKNGGLFSSILNVPIYESSGIDWQVSVQNNRRDLEHLPEHCIVISLEENVAQHNAIPDLKLAFTNLFTGMLEEMKNPDTSKMRKEFSNQWKKRFKMTPRESGVKAKRCEKEYIKECYFKHLRTMFTSDSKRAYANDKASKRLPSKEEERIYADDMFSIGEKQEWRCYYSGHKISMNRNDWNYPSLERLDNTLNHTINNNTVLICRLLNTSGQWSKEKLHFAIKCQKLVDIPDDILAKL